MIHVLPEKLKSVDHPPRHILVVNITRHLGDTVMMMPLLERLRKAAPNAVIELVTSSEVSDFAEAIPFIDRVYGIPISRTAIPIWREYRRLFGIFRFVRNQLFDSQFDLCIVPRWGTDPQMSIFLAAMTSSARIIGHDPVDELNVVQLFPHVGDLLTYALRSGWGMPEAVRELRLIEALGIGEPLDLQEEEFQPVAALIEIADRVSLPSLKRRLGIGDPSYLAISPGASHPARIWAPERFAAVARTLRERFGFQVLVVGGPSEALIARGIKDQLGASCCDATGKTTPIELTALLRDAALLVTNDSGPAHIGAGLGVPTLVLSVCPLTCSEEFESSPLRVRPVGPAVRILQPLHPAPGCRSRCSMREAHCILGISVNDVVENALQLLGATKSLAMR